MKLGTAYVTTGVDMDGLKKGLSTAHMRTKTALGGMDTMWSGLGGRIMKGMGGAIKFIGRQLTSLKALAIVALAGWGIKESIQKFAGFESALVDMGKVTSESMGSIKEKIMDLDPALGSATELVKGYYQVISAGVSDPVKAIKLLETAAKAATAAHTNQAEVIKGITKLMAGYEGKVRTAAEAADLLYTIEKEGQTSVLELIPIIGSLAKISSDLGISQDELGGSLALVTQTAGSTAEAATQYQGVLAALMKPTEAMKKAIKDMGFESAQAAIEQLGLVGTLKKLKDSTGGSQEKLAALFGRLEGLKGISALAANEFVNLNEKVVAMGQKTGAAEKAWKEYKKTLAGIWETFKNSIGQQLIMLGEKLSPAIKNVITDINNWIKANKDMMALKLDEWAKKVADAFVTGAGFMVDAAELVGKAWNGLQVVFHGLVSVIADGVGIAILEFRNLLGWLELVAEGIGLVTGGKVIWDDLANRIKGTRIETEGLLEKVIEFGDKHRNATQDAVDDIGNLDAKFEGLKESVVGWVKEAVSGTAKSKDAVDDLKVGVKDLSGWLESEWEKDWRLNMTIDNTGAKQALNEVKDNAAAIDAMLKQQEIQVKTDKAKIALYDIAGKAKQLSNDIKNMSPEFRVKNQGALDTLAETSEEAQTLIEKLVTGAELTVDTEDAIEKLQGVINKVEEAENKIEGSPIEPVLVTDAAEGQLNVLEEQWKIAVMEMSAPIKISLDTSPAEAAIDSLILGHKEKIATYIKMWSVSGIPAQKQMYMDEIKRLQQQLEKAVSAIRTRFNVVSIDAAPKEMDELQTGTGLKGIPETGPYWLHKGEIVKNPAESEAERHGIKPSGGGMTIHINSPFFVGDKTGARKAAQMIMNEMNELGHRYH